MRTLSQRFWAILSAGWRLPGEKSLLAALGVVLFLFVVFLLILHDKTQQDLREAKKTEFVEEVRRRAEGLGFFFNDRRNDLDDLAMSRSLEAYFLNKDLGVSLRYGLQANLDEVARSMHHLVDSRRFGDDVQEIYRRVTLVDDKGAVLIDAMPRYGAIKTPQPARRLAEFLASDQTETIVRFNGCPTGPTLTVLRPLRHKGRFVGELIAQLRWEPMRTHQLSFGRRLTTIALIDADHCTLYDTLGGGPLASALHRWDGPRTGEAVTRAAGSGRPPIVAVAFPVRTTQFTLVAAMAESELFVGNTSSWLVGALYAMTFLLFASGVVIWRTNMRHDRLQHELRDAQKLEAVGQLAGGIAHEINTPSQYVGNNLKFLADAHGDLFTVIKDCLAVVDDLRDDPAFAERVNGLDALCAKIDLEFLAKEIPLATEQSIFGIEQIASIVLAMKEFSHPGVEEKTPTDLNRAIENTITISRNEWKHVAEVETHFDAALPAVLCLPGEITQVMLNLLVNAAHAIQTAGRGGGGGGANGGRIRIVTAVDGADVVIRVEDNGIGIRDEIRDKIFHPFFTTKEVGKGTGQGLAIAHDIIVNKHGGSIRFETRTGKGTTFIVTLPIHDLSGPRDIEAED